MALILNNNTCVRPLADGNTYIDYDPDGSLVTLATRSGSKYLLIWTSCVLSVVRFDRDGQVKQFLSNVHARIDDDHLVVWSYELSREFPRTTPIVEWNYHAALGSEEG